MKSNSLLSKQIIIIFYLLGAAISAIETSVQFKIGGFSNWKVYFFFLIFAFSVTMYFVRKKQRLENKANNPSK
jgi:uncharacterized membrane protein